MKRSPLGKPIIGLRFGKLVVSRVFRNPEAWFCECICDCGQTCQFPIRDVRHGDNRSCGCLKTQAKHFSHRLTGAPAYRRWQDMLTRCENTNSRSFKNYGGRGIKVCQRWRKFEHFLEDMGSPKKGQTLERKDNEGDYSPDNCRWASRAEQAINKRNNRRFSFGGKTQTLAEWARETGLHHTTILARLKLNWPLQKALTQPTRHAHK